MISFYIFDTMWSRVFDDMGSVGEGLLLHCCLVAETAAVLEGRNSVYDHFSRYVFCCCISMPCNACIQAIQVGVNQIRCNVTEVVKVFGHLIHSVFHSEIRYDAGMESKLRTCPSEVILMDTCTTIALSNCVPVWQSFRFKMYPVMQCSVCCFFKLNFRASSHHRHMLHYIPFYFDWRTDCRPGQSCTCTIPK